MKYEVIAVALGCASTFEVEASSLADARHKAREEIRKVWTQYAITSIRPIGYKPKKDN